MGTQRITCDCMVPTGTTSQPLEFNVNDSLKLRYQFSNKNFNPPLMIPLDAFDVTIEYYVKGRSEKYIAYKKGRVTQNCILYPKNSVIKVILDSHGLKSGQLWATFKFSYQDPEMPDRMAESTVTKFTNIILKETSY